MQKRLKGYLQVWSRYFTPLQVLLFNVIQFSFAKSTEIRKHAQSTNEEIKSNSIFTLGVLCSQSGTSLNQHYSQLVSELFNMTKLEQNKQTLDNICGTLCRLYICCLRANIQGMDYDTVLLIRFFYIYQIKLEIIFQLFIRFEKI